MHHKNVLLVAKTPALHQSLRTLSKAMDISTLLAFPDGFDEAASDNHEFDLVILDMNGIDSELRERVEAYADENGGIPELVVASLDDLPSVQLPIQRKADAMVMGASDVELEFRMANLLWPGEETSSEDFITIDNMTVNLATYQVMIDERPVDLTLMEYSLLSFLATHPSRAYTREALLHRVWGFEYCGGTRTVDVHIRRVRAKVGPQVASHIITVRGVGYLFKV